MSTTTRSTTPLFPCCDIQSSPTYGADSVRTSRPLTAGRVCSRARRSSEAQGAREQPATPNGTAGRFKDPGRSRLFSRDRRRARARRANPLHAEHARTIGAGGGSQSRRGMDHAKGAAKTLETELCYRPLCIEKSIRHCEASPKCSCFFIDKKTSRK